MEYKYKIIVCSRFFRNYRLKKLLYYANITKKKKVNIYLNFYRVTVTGIFM